MTNQPESTGTEPSTATPEPAPEATCTKTCENGGECCGNCQAEAPAPCQSEDPADAELAPPPGYRFTEGGQPKMRRAVEAANMQLNSIVNSATERLFLPITLTVLGEATHPHGLIRLFVRLGTSPEELTLEETYTRARDTLLAHPKHASIVTRPFAELTDDEKARLEIVLNMCGNLAAYTEVVFSDGEHQLERYAQASGFIEKIEEAPQTESVDKIG